MLVGVFQTIHILQRLHKWGAGDWRLHYVPCLHLQHYERQQHMLLPRNGAIYLQAIRSLANIVQSMASEDGLQTSPTLNVHPCRCFLEAMTQDGLHVTGVAGGWQSSYTWMGATGATIVLLCGCVWECEQMRVSQRINRVGRHKCSVYKGRVS